MSLLSEKEILGDRYEIISKLGEGAMGVVFEAIDLVSGQKCAVKILKDPNMSEARHKRFDEEGRCIALLDSPYIVKKAQSWLQSGCNQCHQNVSDSFCYPHTH